jgi:PPOX class probable F420-dependent enzyme
MGMEYEMTAMSPEELEKFLARPLVAILTTLRPDGSPHLAPIWYEYADGVFYFWTAANSVKVRNLRRQPRAVVCVASHEEPYQYVIAEGDCVVSDSELPRRCYSISQRYYGEARGSEFARRDLQHNSSVVLVLTPDRLITESAA